MLSENIRVRAKIQSAFEQLAVPHVAKVRCGNIMIQGALEWQHIYCILGTLLFIGYVHS